MKTFNEFVNSAVDPCAPYGYCPVCGVMGHSRERRPDGNDTCKNGHVYPARTSISKLEADKITAQDRIKKLGLDYT